ncbi:Phosphatidylinositol 4,5-bisphosphate-binding protein SLM1 [Termitomyces sp. J132]|nr:Phosphatidylinositol 4,5-bisphosphate-binding protein SLM1 [Termitomyces sp. J132]
MNHDATSRHASSVSRSQSLIKKNIAPHDLQPSDVLIDRFVAWKAIVKQLIAYFEAQGIADIENNTAKELTRLGAVIQVPFRAGNQFLGEGGLQDIYYGIRDNTRIIADQHANLGRTIDSSIVQHLQKLRTEIKAHIKNVQNDTGKLATNVAKEREMSMRLIAELSSNISNFKNRPMSVTHKTDPFVSNQAVERQLQRQVHEENLLQKSIIIMQQNSAHFEEGIVRAIQSAWQTYDEWSSRSTLAIQDSSRALSLRMSSLAPDREWISFSARSDHLLDPDTPLRNPANITYPSKDDPSVLAVHTGYLERKKRFTRAYRESYFVLTAAGFLHEYAGNDPATNEGITPMFSLFLPACTLGPPATAASRSNKFHIEGRRDGVGTTKAGGIGGGLRMALKGGGAQHAWSFRARSREDMMEWWNDIRMLCARYLVASEQMERSGPVAAAVRAAGYTSEDEGDEEEGSSIEEEQEEDGDEEEEYEEAREEQVQYAHPEKGATNGYAPEPGTSHVHSTDGAQPDAEVQVDDGNRSARQHEKAPVRAVEGGQEEVKCAAEADTPGVAGPEPGPGPGLGDVSTGTVAPADSRFREAL